MRSWAAAMLLLTAGCDPGFSFRGGVEVPEQVEASGYQTLVVVGRPKDPADVEGPVGDILELQPGQTVYGFWVGSIGLPDTQAWEFLSWVSRSSVIDWKERWLARDLTNRAELADLQPASDELRARRDLELPPCRGLHAGSYCPSEMRVDVTLTE